MFNALFRGFPKTPPLPSSSVAIRRHEDVQRLDAILSSKRLDARPNANAANERVSQRVLHQTLALLHKINSSVPSEAPTFRLGVQDSLVGPNSGDGLFLASGTLHPGDVAALYPGTALFHEDVAFFGGLQYMFSEKEMNWFIHRSDGVVLDGLGKTFALNSLVTSLESSSSGDTEGHAMSEIMDKFEKLQRSHAKLNTKLNTDSIITRTTNPYAIAHKANHPPLNVPANVVAVAVDYDVKAMDSHLLPLIPNIHALFPTFYCTQGISFVASHTIHAGDEIYLDYATSLENRPDWYHEAERG